MKTPDGITIIPTVHQEVVALLKSDALAAVEQPIASKRRLKIIYDDGTASISYLRAEMSVSGMTTAAIAEYLSHHKDSVIRFADSFLSDQAAADEEQEFAEGEEQDPQGDAEILGYGNGFGIKMVIYHNFLSHRTSVELITYLKNRSIPKATKFARDLARVFRESQMEN